MSWGAGCGWVPASRVLRTTHCPDALNKQQCLNYVLGWGRAHGTQMLLHACFRLLGGPISLLLHLGLETIFLSETLAVPGSWGKARNWWWRKILRGLNAALPERPG